MLLHGKDLISKTAAFLFFGLVKVVEQRWALLCSVRKLALKTICYISNVHMWASRRPRTADVVQGGVRDDNWLLKTICYLHNVHRWASQRPHTADLGQGGAAA